jgi:hypothetical protein
VGNNLNSSINIFSPIDSTNEKDWFEKETIRMGLPGSLKKILSIVYSSEPDFVKLPKRPLLLWRGSDRIAPPGKDRKYHKYPEILKRIAKQRKIELDPRPNGPAIAAFKFSNGERPIRMGSTNEWSIHHLYSGKFLYPESPVAPLHAIKQGEHFTQSAGLIAVHPMIDALFDEIPAIAWLYRHRSFQLFGYDPMNVFSKSEVNELGFVDGSDCEILFDEKLPGE